MYFCVLVLQGDKSPCVQFTVFVVLPQAEGKDYKAIKLAKRVEALKRKVRCAWLVKLWSSGSDLVAQRCSIYAGCAN